MRKAMKIVGWSVGGLLALVVVVLGVGFAYGGQRLANARPATSATVAVPTDAAAVERGRHLVHAVVSCSGCHGGDLGGAAFLDDPMIGSLPAPNLTGGRGGFAVNATIEDWVLAVRHGVGKDGRALGGMPSFAYANLSDADLGAIFAYLGTVPPVDRVIAARKLTFMGTVLFGTVGYETLSVARVDHGAGPLAHPIEAVGVEYGRYLTTVAACADCHGETYRGGAAGAGPPPGPDITGVGLAGWTEDDLNTLMRSGRRPDGSLVGGNMPWASHAGMTDDELTSMWLFLASLPGGG